MTYPKLNNDITYRGIYLKIKKRENIVFIAERGEIGFQNIEKEIKNIEFKFPFLLPPVNSIDTIFSLLTQEIIGAIKMEPFQKISLLTAYFGGKIFYQKLGSGKQWNVYICF